MYHVGPLIGLVNMSTGLCVKYLTMYQYLCLNKDYSVGAAIMALHYELLVHHYEACPIPMLIGESETGKSTAARCALSVCGQHNVGHMMKTKSTSDSLCIERCASSTIPRRPKDCGGCGRAAHRPVQWPLEWQHESGG